MNHNIRIPIAGLVLVSIILFNSSCDIADSRLVLQNNTTKTIYFKWQEDSILSENRLVTHYKFVPPDEETGEYPRNISNLVFPDSSNIISIWTFRGWNKYFKKNKFLYLYIFDEDTLSTYSWDTIRSQKKYLKRIDLTFEDIKQSKWVLVYSEDE